MTPPLDPSELFSFRALWSAARRAAREKRLRPAVARFKLTLERELLDLHADLLADVWRPAAPRIVHLRDPKPRVISIPPFRDRVVHQALCVGLAPRIERRLITHSFACRVGQGSHAALRLARAWARTYGWWVRLDVARYFPTIDHAVVREHLARDVPEEPIRALCSRILDAAGTVGGQHVPGDDLFAASGRRVGLPLGNLTSQLWANRYLDPIDHLVKDRLRHRPYLRYMDDMLLLHDDRAALTALAREVETACHGLRLRLHPWSVQPTAAGVGFVGFRIMPDHVRVRRSTVRRAEGRMREQLRIAGGVTEDFQAGLRSVFAHWDHADTWRLKERTLHRLRLLYEPDGNSTEDASGR